MNAGISVISIKPAKNYAIKEFMFEKEDMINRASENRKSGRGKIILFWTCTILLVIALFLCIGETAHSMEKRSAFDSSMDSYYKSVEMNFVSTVKDILKNEGYEYAGVMLTKRTREDGPRTYNLNIHHRRFNDERKADIEQKIRSIELDVPGSVLNITFD